MDIDALLAKYSSGYDLLKSQLKLVPERAIYYKPSPNQWSIAEIIVHLADSEAHGFVRAKKIIAESGGRVGIYNQQIWAEQLYYDKMEYRDALELIRIVRKNLHRVLSLIPDVTWYNYIYHPESGKITLLDWIHLYTDHIDIHIQQIHRNLYEWEKKTEKAIA